MPALIHTGDLAAIPTNQRSSPLRAVTSRSLSVKSVEGNGFVAVRKVDEPGKRRGRPRKRQDHSLDEVLAAADNERIVPEPVIET